MSRPPSAAPRASYASGLAPTSIAYAPPTNVSDHYGPGPGAPMYSSTALSQRPPSRHEPPPLASTAGPMPGTLERPIPGPKKRLIMTCDGTWLNADNGIMNGHKQPPSNVSRIGWAIKETSRDGIPQIVSYQAGVGSKGSELSRVVGGATGQGLKENVREAYTYIASNWREGDEIFLIGFSRGAFTARSVGGMIGELGLLTRKGLPYFNEIFEDLEHKTDDRYVSKYSDIPFPNKGRFDKRYLSELQRRGLTRTSIPIKAIGCFDTVGSLGIPSTPMMSMFAAGRQAKQYQFYDTSLNPCIENAFQALALDEHRAPFSPALWEKRSDNDRTNLKQVWFPGVHSNVGGGYDDQEISNLTLAWMISRLEPFLDFRSDFLISQHVENVKYYQDTGQKPRPWSFGEIYRSLKGVYSFAGSKTRTPGNYYRTDPYSGRPTTKKLRNTNEYIHASVRTRLGLQGPGIEDRGVYEPRALHDWTFEAEAAPGPGQGGNMNDGGLVVWTYRGSNKGGQDRIPEAVLLETEIALLKQSSRLEEYVKTGAKQRGSRRRRDVNDGGYPNGDGAAMNGGGGNSRRNGRVRSISIQPPDGLDSADEKEKRRRRRRTGDPRDLDDRDYDPDRRRDSSRRRRRGDDDY